MYVKLNAIVKILYLCNCNNVRLHFKCICSIEIQYTFRVQRYFLKWVIEHKTTQTKEAFYLFGLRAEATAGPWTRNLSAESDKVSLTPNKRSEGLSQH